MSEEGGRDVHDPLLGLDIKRLEKEMARYHEWFDERTEEAYNIAIRARSLGLDHTTEVEIPRASDLAGRTEQLLSHHLDGEEVADDIRLLLADFDRETTAIKMAELVSIRLRKKGADLKNWNVSLSSITSQTWRMLATMLP